MEDFETFILSLPPQEREAQYLDYYGAFWINSTGGFKKNAIDQLRRSAEVAKIGEFSLERIFQLQDRVVKQHEKTRKMFRKLREH